MQKQNEKMEALSKTLPFIGNDNHETLGDNYYGGTFYRGDDECHSKHRGKSRRERLRDILAPRSRTRDHGASQGRQSHGVLGRVKIPKLNYPTSDPKMQNKERSNTLPLILPPINTSRTAETYPLTKGKARSKDHLSRHSKLGVPSKYNLNRSLGSLTDRQPRVPRYGDKLKSSPNYSQKQQPKPLDSPDALVFKASRRINREMRNSDLAAGLKRPREPNVANSIRKKIEQYKKWHDEHYKVQLDQFKKESEEKDKRLEDEAKSVKEHKVEEHISVPKLVDFKPGLRVSPHNTVLPNINKKTIVDSKRKENRNIIKETDKNSNPKTPTSRSSSPPAKVPEELLNQRYSARTWRTWRNVNDSFCYSNVKQYIKENELMDDEKEGHINRWLDSVHHATRTTALSSEGNFDIDPSSKLDTG